MLLHDRRGSSAACAPGARASPAARGSRPVNIAACDGSVQQAALCAFARDHAARGELRDRRRRARRRAERLERVAPRRVEHDQQDVRHGTIPSTNGTSKTFSCMTGPWPKKRSSPNSSPWSDVTITHVFDGSRSNSRLNTPSR